MKMKRNIKIIFLLIPVVFTLLACNFINFIDSLYSIEIDMTSTAEAIEMTTTPEAIEMTTPTGSDSGQDQLTLEECDLTHLLTYVIDGPKIIKFSESSPCSQDCSATVNITNSSREILSIYNYRYSYGRDVDLDRTDEWWELVGAPPKLPGETDQLSWKKRYAENDSCQWVDYGITKILAIRDDQGCSWLKKYYDVNFENSGIQMLEIAKPCP
jgi:hypothetical protein